MVDIQAVFALFVLFVIQEEVRNSLWILSYSADGGHQPAIPEIALGHVGWCDTIWSPQSSFWPLFARSFPINAFSLRCD